MRGYQALIVFSILAVLSSPIPKETLEVDSDVVLSDEFLIAGSEFDEYNPDVDGDIVVWQTIGISAYDHNILGYRVDTQEYFSVSVDSHVDETLPRVSGEWVVWLGYSTTQGMKTQVLAKNIQTEEQRVVVTVSCDHCIYSFDVTGDFIVWADIDVWVYRFSTEQTTRITNDFAVQDYTAIDPPWVAWRHQPGGGNSYIYAYNMNTGQTITPTLGVGDGFGNFADISDGIMVWEGTVITYPVSVRAYFAKNLGTEEVYTMTVTTDETIWYPRISGDFVVWNSNESGNDEIYLYDLQASKLLQVTNSTYSDQAPSVGMHTIVWRRYDDQRGWNIYGVNLFSYSVYLPILTR